ncbi:hypothetical protein [Streptomyces virginiae]|uniref:hypothetical protein n=1 Tax=Streptomyces virginiae TaxID=1961 RepID=UPI003453CF40
MPETPRSPRARRLAIAAAVANGAGAAAGATAHFLGCDPDTSVSVGVLVSTSVGDVLKQWASADTADPAGTEAPDPATEFAAPRDPAELPSGTAPDAVPTSAPGLRPAHRIQRAGRRYARCSHPPVSAGAVPVEPPLPRAAPAGPRHVGHRRLQRGAQKFVRRAHGRVRPGREVAEPGGEA